MIPFNSEDAWQGVGEKEIIRRQGLFWLDHYSENRFWSYWCSMPNKDAKAVTIHISIGD